MPIKTGLMTRLCGRLFGAKFSREVCYVQLTDMSWLIGAKPYRRFESLFLRHAVWTDTNGSPQFTEILAKSPPIRSFLPLNRTGENALPRLPGVFGAEFL